MRVKDIDNLDETGDAETIRRQFLHKETPTGKFRRQGDLMKFLQDEYKRYPKVLPLYPSDDEDFEAYDDAKTDFLESLWDVISQHFDDLAGGKRT